MYKWRKKEERGHTKLDWLSSYHTFSFGNYYDPEHMGFSDLRVINDDIVAPKGGFGAHSHRDMEILTLVLSGSLEHRDSLGTGSIIKPGDLQRMSAGTGVTHSEFNPSDKEPLHFLQIWIMPSIAGVKTSYDQKFFDPLKSLENFVLLASPDGQLDSISIHQDAKMYQILLHQDSTASFPLSPNRAYWVHLATGALLLHNTKMQGGDGAAITKEEDKLLLKGLAPLSNVILFDLKTSSKK